MFDGGCSWIPVHNCGWWSQAPTDWRWAGPRTLHILVNNPIRVWKGVVVERVSHFRQPVYQGAGGWKNWLPGRGWRRSGPASGCCVVRGPAAGDGSVPQKLAQLVLKGRRCGIWKVTFPHAWSWGWSSFGFLQIYFVRCFQAFCLGLHGFLESARESMPGT